MLQLRHLIGVDEEEEYGVNNSDEVALHDGIVYQLAARPRQRIKRKRTNAFSARYLAIKTRPTPGNRLRIE